MDSETLATRGMLTDPGDHFKGRYEVERKYRVLDLETIRVRLPELGAVAFTQGNEEQDSFFDSPDRRLERNNQQLSLRHMKPSGRVLWISKGPGVDECVAMDLSDFDKASDMLTSLGFEKVMTLSKRRDIYFLGRNIHITLDDVDGLGTFVELASMTDNKAELLSLNEKIVETAVLFGLGPSQLETQSYRSMLSSSEKTT